ncbi:MAG: ferrochelatase [Planctomycetota bacterium]
MTFCCCSWGRRTRPTAAGLRPYLREFLGDPRIIEAPAFVRWLVVNLIIVPFRSPKSAVKYRRIWDSKAGSPLLDITRRQTQALSRSLGSSFRVHFAMRYGNPSIRAVVRQMMQAGCSRLVVLPMFPQYSATTTASGLDGLFDAFKNERVLPSMRIISEYHQDPAYLDAVVDGVNSSPKFGPGGNSGMPPNQFSRYPGVYIERGILSAAVGGNR